MRVLIVDDSALMRKQLVQMLQEEGDIEVAVARNGVEAIEVLRTFRPDVVTLDINMPEMDGLSALSLIMAEQPTPVIMVSSLTQKGAGATLEALAMGAVDFIGKPDGTISLSMDRIRDQLVAQIRAAAKARLPAHRRKRPEVIRHSPAPIARASASSAAEGELPVVIIGVSTGGPGTLEQILPELPADFPAAVVVAQHMPATFTGALADRLDRLCAVKVQEIRNTWTLEPGVVGIARGGADVTLSRRANRLAATPLPEDAQRFWHPSVGRLMASAMEKISDSRQLIGVMLTGMGNDGAQEMALWRRKGGRTIAEDASTSVVFGMPQELIHMNGATAILPNDRIAAQLVHWLADRTR